MFQFYAVPITHKLPPSSDAGKVLHDHIDKRNKYFHLAFRMHRGDDPCVTEKAKSEFISMTAYLHQTHQFTDPHGSFLNGGLKHLDGHDVRFKPLPKCEPNLPSVPWYPRERYMHVTVGKQAQPAEPHPARHPEPRPERHPEPHPERQHPERPGKEPASGAPEQRLEEQPEDQPGQQPGQLDCIVASEDEQLFDQIMEELGDDVVCPIIVDYVNSMVNDGKDKNEILEHIHDQETWSAIEMAQKYPNDPHIIHILKTKLPGGFKDTCLKDFADDDNTVSDEQAKCAVQICTPSSSRTPLTPAQRAKDHGRILTGVSGRGSPEMQGILKKKEDPKEEKDAKINPTNLRDKFDREADKPGKTPESAVGSVTKVSDGRRKEFTENAPCDARNELDETKCALVTIAEDNKKKDAELTRQREEIQRLIAALSATRAALSAADDQRKRKYDALLESREEEQREPEDNEAQKLKDKIANMEKNNPDNNNFQNNFQNNFHNNFENVTPSYGQCDSGEESAMAEGVRNKRQRIPNSPEECVGIARDSRGVLKG